MKSWDNIAQDWLDQTVQRGREGWNQLTGRRQYLVVQTLQDLAKLRAVELVGGVPDPEEVKIATATLNNLGTVASIVVARTVMDVLRDSLKMAGSIITGILGKVTG